MKKILSIFSAILVTSTISARTSACVKPLSEKHKLKDDLTNLKLGVINEKNPGEIPTFQELLSNLHDKNLKLDINKINLSNIRVDSADVTGDGIFYTKDTLNVSFQETTLNINRVIVEETDLGKIVTASTVSADQVKTAIQNQIPAVDTTHIIVNVLNNKRATVTGDDIVYNGSVNVTFTTDNSVILSSIIDSGKPLIMAIPGQKVPTNTQIITKLKEMYKNLDTNIINVSNITELSATIGSADQTRYRGTVNVTLQLDKRIDLNNIINKGLSKVAISGNSITSVDVIKSLKKQYSTLNIDAISVILSKNNKTATVTSTNKNIYTGADVVINDLLIDLNSVVLKTTLPQFIIPGKSVPTLEQIKTALLVNNPNLVIDNIIIGTPSSTSVNLTGDGDLYSKDDTVTINYTCDVAVSLDSVFTKKELGTISTNGIISPSVKQITTAISEANPNLNMKAINFSDSNISTNQVVVVGDGITYKGSVTATFTVDSNTISVGGFNYNHTETNSVGSLKVDWTGPTQVILDNWTNYASDWNSFTTKFSKLSFGNDALFGIYCNTYIDKKLTGWQLDVNTNNIGADRNVSMFQENFSHDGGFWGCTISLNAQLHIWHDATKIYVNYTGNCDTMNCYRDRVLNVKLPSATFSK